MSNIKKLTDYEGNVVHPEISEEQIKHKANIDDIPTKISQMENDAEFITIDEVPDVDLSDIEQDINKLQMDKIDKVEGLGLSSNDFTDALKQKLELLQHITKLSELEQDIQYLVAEDLNPLKADIASNTELIHSEVNKVLDMIDSIEIPEVNLTPIEDELMRLEDTKANKSDVQADLLQAVESMQAELKKQVDLIDRALAAKVDAEDLVALEELLNNHIQDQVGTLEDLTTEAKSNLVSAINEVNAKEVDLSGVKNDIKDLQDEKANISDMEQSLSEKQDKLGYTPENNAKRGKADGYTPLDANSKIPLQYIPDIAKQQTYVVDTIDEMYEIDDLIVGEKCFIVEDSDTYIWDGESWLVVSKAEWENISLDWENIENRPKSTQEQIDGAINKSHNHDNITQLNKVSEQMFDDIFDARMHILSGKIHLNDEDMAAIADVSNKANKNDVYSKTQVDEKIDKKADAPIVEEVKADTQRIDKDIAKRLGAIIPRHVGVDYNDFVETGFYFVAPRQENCPPELWNTSIYLTVVATEGNIYQRAVTYDTGQIAKRQYTNEHWNDWQYDLDLTSENIQKELGFTPISQEDVDSSISSKADKGDIPTKVSQLQNDSKYVSSVKWSEIKEKPGTFKPETHTHTISDVADLQGKLDVIPTKADKSEIPTKVGQLENDKKYITLEDVPKVDVPVTSVNKQVGDVVLSGEDIAISKTNAQSLLDIFNTITKDISEIESGKADVSEVPTLISDLTDNTSSKPVKYAERVQIKDTRNVDDSPLDIMKSGKPSLSFDFKRRSVVGNPDSDISAHGSYAHVLTVYGWSDNTGGYPTQVSFGKEKIGVRTGVSNTEWSQWRKFSSDDMLKQWVQQNTLKVYTQSAQPNSMNVGDQWHQIVD